MKKQKKGSVRKSIIKDELNVSCHNLGKADHEGWLSKKAGGHGIIPISWKRYWCVLKDAKFYCYKTSFDSFADYILLVKDYTIESITEKKKIAFCMKPLTDGSKPTIFGGNEEEEVKNWVEILKKILSGVNISQKNGDNIPHYEEEKNKTLSDGSPKTNRKRHSSAFQRETETTGLPTTFSSRTTSLSTSRPRFGSNAGKGESVLAVGSIIKSLDEPDEQGEQTQADKPIDILYKEEVSEEITEESDRAADDKEISEPSLDALLKEVEQLKTGAYHTSVSDGIVKGGSKSSIISQDISLENGSVTDSTETNNLEPDDVFVNQTVASPVEDGSSAENSENQKGIIIAVDEFPGEIIEPEHQSLEDSSSAEKESTEREIMKNGEIYKDEIAEDAGSSEKLFIEKSESTEHELVVESELSKNDDVESSLFPKVTTEKSHCTENETVEEFVQSMIEVSNSTDGSASSENELIESVPESKEFEISEISVQTNEQPDHLPIKSEVFYTGEINNDIPDVVPSLNLSGDDNIEISSSSNKEIDGEDKDLQNESETKGEETEEDSNDKITLDNEDETSSEIFVNSVTVTEVVAEDDKDEIDTHVMSEELESSLTADTAEPRELIEGTNKMLDDDMNLDIDMSSVSFVDDSILDAVMNVSFGNGNVTDNKTTESQSSCNGHAVRSDADSESMSDKVVIANDTNYFSNINGDTSLLKNSSVDTLSNQESKKDLEDSLIEYI